VLELGQPLHAYDLNKFGGIIVRYARAQETSDAGWSRR
jgi:phenylalanyl-tRNA synthetase beta subunit